MGRLIHCQTALVPWGTKAKFRRSKLGLFRKGSTVYLAIFFNPTQYFKFQLDPRLVDILPAAIRFNETGEDLFIRQVSDEQQYKTLMREIKVILKRDKLRQTGKADALEKFISSIPQLSAIGRHEIVPARAGIGRLHEVTLTDCQLTYIPKELEKLSETLTSLNLSRNSIKKLPRTFCCKMNNLRSIDISHNQIETLPIEIKFFSRLVDLNISDNRLRMLPSTFSDLKSLRNLNVANNNLSQLPAFRREEIRLQQLDVSHNPLDGALHEASTFQALPCYNGDQLDYHENLFSPLTVPISKNKLPTLFEASMLSIVRNDDLFKKVCQESIPRTIISTMQRDVFKCYKCSKMNMLPAYNSTDILDYVDQVEVLLTNGNYRHGMTFMKLICRSCFDYMSS